MSLATSPVSEPLRLRTLLATYPHTAPLKNGEVTSPRVTLDFKDVTPVWSGFKAMVRERAFDVSGRESGELLHAREALARARQLAPGLLGEYSRGAHWGLGHRNLFMEGIALAEGKRPTEADGSAVRP